MRWLNVEQSFRELPFLSILFLAVAVASQDVCSFRSDTKVAANATKTFFPFPQMPAATPVSNLE